MHLFSRPLLGEKKSLYCGNSLNYLKRNNSRWMRGWIEVDKGTGVLRNQRFRAILSFIFYVGLQIPVFKWATLLGTEYDFDTCLIRNMHALLAQHFSGRIYSTVTPHFMTYPTKDHSHLWPTEFQPLLPGLFVVEHFRLD